MITSAVWEYYDPEERMIQAQKKHIAGFEKDRADLKDREKQANKDIKRMTAAADAWSLLMKAVIPADATVSPENYPAFAAWKSFFAAAMMINRGPVQTPCINKLVK